MAIFPFVRTAASSLKLPIAVNGELKKIIFFVKRKKCNDKKSQFHRKGEAMNAIATNCSVTRSVTLQFPISRNYKTLV